MARDLGHPGDDARRRLGRHQRRRHPADARERVHDPGDVYVHASTLTRDSYQRIAATGGSISVATESECSAGQGHAPTEQVLQYGIPVSLSMDTSVWWSGDMFSAMRATLNADRMAEHLDAHLKGETITHLRLRAQQVVEWATRGGAHALGRDDLGSLRAGQEGRRRPDQERRLPRVVPAAQPLRARRLPGPARRRAHRARRRPGREVRRQAGRHRPRAGAPGDRVDDRVPEGRVRRGDLAAGHVPRDAGGRGRRSSTTRTSTPTTRTSRSAPAARSGCSAAERGRTRRSGHGGARYAGRTSSRRSRAGSTSSPASTPTTGSMSLSEVAAAAGLARPTARRLLLTLEELGFVRSCGGAFALTPKVLTLGMAYVGALGLWDIARPHLRGAGRRAPASRRPWRSSTARTSSTSPGSRCPRSSRSGSTSARASPPSRRRRARCCSPPSPPSELDGHPRRPEPRRACRPTSAAPPTSSRDELTEIRARGWALADEELAPGRPLGRRPGPGRRRRRPGGDERDRARRGDDDRAAARGAPAAAAADRRRRQRRVGAVAEPRPHVELARATV